MTVDKAMYSRVFVTHKEGEMILDDLERRFSSAIFVKGGLDGDRQTCFNAGQRSVIDFIFRMISNEHNDSNL